jgi:hypothetical protein
MFLRGFSPTLLGDNLGFVIAGATVAVHEMDLLTGWLL